MSKSELEFSQESMIRLLNTIQEKTLEERDLALDRFRRQDAEIDDGNAFFLQGKILVDYLRVAADRTDALFNLLKLQAGIVFKTDGATNTASTLSDDDIKKAIQKQLTESSADSSNFNDEIKDINNDVKDINKNNK